MLRRPLTSLRIKEAYREPIFGSGLIMIIADTKPRSTQIMSALIGVLIVRNVAIAITLLTVKKFRLISNTKKPAGFPPVRATL